MALEPKTTPESQRTLRTLEGGSDPQVVCWITTKPNQPKE
jgi:hypothetical protein